MIIGVDIDGTICEEQDNFFKLSIPELIEYYKTAVPDEKAIGLVNELATAGNTIRMVTARSDVFREATVLWLKNNQVEYDDLVMGVPFCDMYIGDNYYGKEKLL